MKKLLLLLLIFSGLTSVFAAGEGDESSTEPVEFDYWTSQTQTDRQATIQVLIDTYMALNPHVTINLVPVDENDLPTQLNAAGAAGGLPGLAEMGAENAVAFGSQGVFDMEATESLINEIGSDNFYDGVLRLVGNTDGEYYALPLYGWIQGIWYRSDWFEEAGLAPPNTWDNILKAAQYFYKPEENQYGILVGTMGDEVFSEQCFTPLALANDAGIFDKDGNLVFNSPEMREAVEYYAELAKYNPPGPQTWRARDYYIQGKMAMFFYSTYIMDDLAKAENAAGSLTGDNFSDLSGGTFDPELAGKTGFAPIITNERPAGYGVVMTMTIPKQEDPRVSEAAAKFLRYIYTPNAYITFLHMAPGGMNPTIKGIADNARYQADPQELYKRYGPEKMTQIVSGMNEIETFSIVEGNRIDTASAIFANKIIPQMIFAITQEGKSVEDAMAEAEEAMQKLMES